MPTNGLVVFALGIQAPPSLPLPPVLRHVGSGVSGGAAGAAAGGGCGFGVVVTDGGFGCRGGARASQDSSGSCCMRIKSVQLCCTVAVGVVGGGGREGVAVSAW